MEVARLRYLTRRVDPASNVQMGLEFHALTRLATQIGMSDRRLSRFELPNLLCGAVKRARWTALELGGWFGESQQVVLLKALDVDLFLELKSGVQNLLLEYGFRGADVTKQPLATLALDAVKVN